MKNRIIFLYIIYAISIYFICLIDTAILMYYIFWINNIFMIPLFWFIIKTIYFNRCILLLLLFYYLIAKFTIKQSGYKYFLFFNIDVAKWHRIYFNYIFSITTYHIEILSIFIFFSVIILPFFLFNKSFFFLFTNLTVFLFFLCFIIRKRIKYIKQKKKKFSLIKFFFFWIFFFITIKLFNYYNFKEFITLYVHLDKWAFELLQWKIQMYEKATEKDLYIRTIGLKPVWVGDKPNKMAYTEKIYWERCFKNKKAWESFFKKNTIKIKIKFNFNFKPIKLKHKFEREYLKYYSYIKHYKHLYNEKLFKYTKIMDELKKKKKYMLKKEERRRYIRSLEDPDNLIQQKEYHRRLNLKNENPVVTQEKERERLLHHVVLVGSAVLKLSFDNYYNLNLALKDLTLKHLYYQPFFDKKSIEKYRADERKLKILTKLKEPILEKKELTFFRNIIKQYKIFIQKHKNETLEEIKILGEKKNSYKYFFLKLLDYFILKLGKADTEIIKKKEKFNFQKFLVKIKNNIKLKEKLNKAFFSISKKEVLKKDTIKSQKQGLVNMRSYMDKQKLESTNNKVLFNTVRKYNEEGNINREDWLKEFNRVLILEKKKGDLKRVEGPDLSRRNKK